MSNKSALTELAEFVAKSPLAAEDINVRRAAMNSLRDSFEYQPVHKRVTDLLGTVLVLSARTRRVVQPRTEVALEVFGPNSSRAVSMKLS